MFELLILMALIGAAILLPLLLVGLVLRLVFHVILLPFHLLGAIIGISVAGLVLGVLALVFGTIVGVLTLAGALFAGLPLLLVALVVWGLIRLVRHERRPKEAA